LDSFVLVPMCVLSLEKFMFIANNYYTSYSEILLFYTKLEDILNLKVN
jgi:hypothetical protein